MLITMNPVSIIVGKTTDAQYDVIGATETCFTPESKADRDAIVEFVSAHVPFIDDERHADPDRNVEDL